MVKLSRFVIIFLLLLALGIDLITPRFVINAKFNCQPDQSEVALFADVNYQGECVLLKQGAYPNLQQQEFNDRARSIKLGAGVFATLFKLSDFSMGDVWDIEKVDKPDLGIGGYIGINKDVSSVVVQQKKSLPDVGEVTFYTDYGFSGGWFKFRTGARQDYFVVGDDTLSSFMVNKVSVRMCEHKNFVGRCATLDISIANMNSTRVGNDTMSSFAVNAIDAH